MVARACERRGRCGHARTTLDTKSRSYSARNDVVLVEESRPSNRSRPAKIDLSGFQIPGIVTIWELSLCDHFWGLSFWGLSRPSPHRSPLGIPGLTARTPPRRPGSSDGIFSRGGRLVELKPSRHRQGSLNRNLRGGQSTLTLAALIIGRPWRFPLLPVLQSGMTQTLGMVSAENGSLILCGTPDRSPPAHHTPGQ